MKDIMITVCDKCFRVSCLYGHFLCEEARTAGTIEMKRSELIKLDLEDVGYIDSESDTTPELLKED